MATLYTANRKETLGEYPLALITGGRYKVMHDTYTYAAAGAIGDVITFPKLLAGRVVVYPMMSWIRADDADTNAVLALGHNAYVNRAGTTVAANTAYWMTAVAVGAGNIQGLWPAITGITTAGARPGEFDAQDGLEIVMTISTAAANSTDVYELVVVYGHIQ